MTAHDSHGSHVKGTQRIPESYLPSLATSCENMVSNSERADKGENTKV